MFLSEFASALRIAARSQTAQHFGFEMNLFSKDSGRRRVSIYRRKVCSSKLRHRCHLLGDGDASRADTKDFDALICFLRTERSLGIQFGFHSNDVLTRNEFSEQRLEILRERGTRVALANFV